MPLERTRLSQAHQEKNITSPQSLCWDAGLGFVGAGSRILRAGYTGKRVATPPELLRAPPFLKIDQRYHIGRVLEHTDEGGSDTASRNHRLRLTGYCTICSMVLRKPLPPGIQAPDRGDGRLEQQSATSAPIAASSPSSSSRRAGGRPRSASQTSQTSAPQSVYSPDLNTSPAFDLMTLDQAQRSPVGAPFPEPQNPWAEELVEKPEQDPNPSSAPENNSSAREEGLEAENKTGVQRVPPIVTESTQQRQVVEELQSNPVYRTPLVHARTESAPQQFQSNNPFLRARQPEYNPWEDHATRSAPPEGTSQPFSWPANGGQGYPGHRASESR